MGQAVLGDLLNDWTKYALDDSIYVPAGADRTLDLRVTIVPSDPTFEPGRIYNGEEYLLGIEQVRDVVTGLERELKRPPTSIERLRAVLYYALYDGFIDLKDLLAG